jgi:hypothetical protein
MANITEEHLHHMARRHHATMKKLDGLRDRFSGIAQRGIGTVETAAAAWIGGAIEGRTNGKAIGPVPINLGAGVLLLAAGHLDLAGDKYSEHLNNLGNGLIGSYLAAVGYSFGKNWRDTGKMFGGHSWGQPYGGGAMPGPAVQGDLSQARMNEIIHNMSQAAQAPVHP